MGKFLQRINLEKYLTKITALLILVFLVLGGLGIKTIIVIGLAILAGFLLLFLVWFYKKTIKIPKHFYLFLAVIFLIALSFIWSVNKSGSITFFLLYLSSAIFWLLIFNIKKSFQNYFGYLLVTLGIVYCILFLYFSFMRSTLFSGTINLIFPSSVTLKHNHLGDLLVVVLIGLYFLIVRKRKYLFSFFVPFAVFLFIVSQSRSAYLSLLAGFVLVFSKFIFHKRMKLLITLTAIFVIALFMLASTQKDVFGSRTYFIESLFGFLSHPFGVGMGNFSIISSYAVDNLKWLPQNFSYYTHDIFLEFLSGIGILGIVFVVWVYKNVSGLLQNINTNKIGLAEVVWVAIGVNFLFDYSYIIPTIFWLWFISLALFQTSEKNT